MDHLQAIRAFFRVVETGQFNSAAQSLNIPNATLSKAIKSLELHLGVKLFERNTRRVTITNDGAAYYQRTQHLVSELDNIESMLGRSQSSPSGKLRVDTGGAVASNLLIPRLPEFCERFPDIQVQLGVTDRTVDVIGENIDCAIRSTAEDQDLISKKIGTLNWTTCASANFIQRYGKPLHPQQLAEDDFPVLGYFSAHNGQLHSLQFKQQQTSLEITPSCKVMVNESNAHLAAALAGLGIIHTLDFMVRPAIERGDLIAILEEWRPNPLDVYIAYAPSRQLNTKVRVFIEWVTTIFNHLDNE